MKNRTIFSLIGIMSVAVCPLAASAATPSASHPAMATQKAPAQMSHTAVKSNSTPAACAKLTGQKLTDCEARYKTSATGKTKP